jgi:hypothetical protein
VGRVVFGNHTAGVEIIRHNTLIGEGQRNNFCRLGKSSVSCGFIAECKIEHDIVAVLRPNQRRGGLDRLGRLNHMRQLFPSDRDGFGGILGLLASIGHNKGNRVADVARLTARQDGIGWYVEDGIRKFDSAWQRAEIACLGSGKHQVHAGHRPRLRGVDLKARMRVGRP